MNPQHSFIIKTIISRHSEELSVIEVAQSLVNLLVDLSKIDPVFSDAIVISAGNNNYNYEISAELSKSEKDKIAEQFAEDFIEHAKSDILQHDKEPNPTIKFRRAIGFTSSLGFGGNGSELKSSYSLGSSMVDVFNIKYLARSKEKYFPFDWYENIIKCLVNHFDPLYSALLFAGLEFYDESKELNLPEVLGWITYLKNNGELIVPDKLATASIEEYRNGRVIVFSRDEEYFHELSQEERREIVLADTKKLVTLQ